MQSTRIALVGYGKMGREIDRLAPSMGCEVTARFDVDAPFQPTRAGEFDVALDFSAPTAAVANIEGLCRAGTQIVCGTTGWESRMDEVRRMVENAGIGMIHAPNFSIGMALFHRVVREAARAFGAFDEYDVAVHETHHRMKLDAPSGTALALSASILADWPRKRSIATDPKASASQPSALLVSSARVGNVAGEHVVRIESPSDSVTLSHAAHDRSGFATGALRAARWIVGRRGMFGMDDLVADLLAQR